VLIFFVLFYPGNIYFTLISSKSCPFTIFSLPTYKLSFYYSLFVFPFESNYCSAYFVCPRLLFPPLVIMYARPTFCCFLRLGRACTPSRRRFSQNFLLVFCFFLIFGSVVFEDTSCTCSLPNFFWVIFFPYRILGSTLKHSIIGERWKGRSVHSSLDL